MNFLSPSPSAFHWQLRVVLLFWELASGAMTYGVTARLLRCPADFASLHAQASSPNQEALQFVEFVGDKRRKRGVSAGIEEDFVSTADSNSTTTANLSRMMKSRAKSMKDSNLQL